VSRHATESDVPVIESWARLSCPELSPNSQFSDSNGGEYEDDSSGL